ncbi:MAG: Cys-Xaa-Xaa-Xaa repeat radical SAM target protein [Muribaculaceae bacterium]|nr:Cys-Xaa-Xaa-Xaa repeat radical SAM target protein [Muribaculaceae bacterium]
MSDQNKKEELQSRRQFFKKAAKAALPILGAIVASNVPLLSNATETENGCSYGCTYGCSGSCGRACSYGCQNSCAGSCDGACKGWCTGSCKGSCSGSCRGYSY